MDRYCPHQTPCQPAAGQAYLDYLRLNSQDKGVKDCFGASNSSSRSLTPSEVEEYHRRGARYIQEANSRWARPERVPTRTNGAFTAPHQGTIPVVQVENLHEYLRRCESADEATRLERMGISAQQYYNELAMAQRALARKPAQQRRDEQKREQEKTQLPAAKPGNLYPRPSRISGPIRPVHDDDMERRTMSSMTLSMQPKSDEAYREACRMYHETNARKKEEEWRKAAVSVPTPEPTRTESVKQLLSSVNKALEQKVEAAELEAADTECLEREALRAQSQQLRQDQNDANQAARQCGQSFWHEYSANYPTAGCSSMSKNRASSPPIPQKEETIMGPEVRADGKNVENARETGPLGDLDVESEWEEVDDDLGDEGWSDVEEDVGDDARRESSDVEWASDIGSEGPCDY